VQEINEKEKKELIQELNRKYKGDFSFLENYLIFKNSENKYFIFSGEYLTNGERCGLEAFKIDNGKIRLNFHFANLFKDKIKDYFMEINKELAKKFIKGEDLFKENLNNINFEKLEDKEFYLLKYDDYFIGVVKVIKKEGILKNYLAKQYRFKNIEI
jgi:NOL1/NOP2/fmu family ribosome biogenesis protein